MECKGWLDIVLILAIANVGLSFLQWFLERFMNRTKTEIDNKLYLVVSFLLESLKWVMANRGPRK